MLASGCGGSDDDSGGAEPIRLHPDNPRYLEFRGRPTVLVTSGEHYGAVVNADFDHVRYLDELQRHGFNLTRVFSGSYVESESFISGVRERNTLSPRPGRFVRPWAESDEPRPGGGHKLDLTSWNPAYFDRLKRFVEEAGKRGIVVELTLFSALYTLDHWRASPFNPVNNSAGAGPKGPEPLYTLDNAGALEHQDAFVRKLVGELSSFDNLYYEVINEGWTPPTVASDAWEDHIIATIEEAESDLPGKHLIARNYQRTIERIDPHPSVSIYNFHYQRDVSRYGNIEGVLSFDETGVQGNGDAPYIADAWHFMLSGGGIYNNLDWSFAVGNEDGSYEVPPETPGGGGPTLRRSLAALKRFLERFEIARLRPADEVVLRAPAGATTRALGHTGRALAVYISGGSGGSLEVDVPPGRYRAEWVDTGTGAVTKDEVLEHRTGRLTLDPPAYEGDVALALEAE